MDNSKWHGASAAMIRGTNSPSCCGVSPATRGVGRVGEPSVRFPTAAQQAADPGAWLSLAEHLVRNEGVVGSNPIASTS